MVKLVGILNVTPDSFSDGGKFNNVETAIKQTINLIKQGANIIDIGAESTRPGADAIDHDEEWHRLKYILPEIISVCKNLDTKVSLDSRHYKTVKKALNLDIDIINDVTGFCEENMLRLAAAYNKELIVMHNLGVPARKDKIIDTNKDELEIVHNWMKEKLDIFVEFGIKKENIIFDPGVGFGKNAIQSINIIRNIDYFKDLGLKIYVGHSRKSFLENYPFIKDHQHIDSKTLEVSRYLANRGIEYLRVHNIKIHSSLE